MGTKENRSWEGAGNTGIFFKEDSHKESDHCSWGKTRAWEIHAICPVGDQKQFLSNSLWEGDLARAKKHFQENKCEGERQGPPSLPMPGCSSRPHSTATCQADGQPPQETLWENPIPLPLGKQKNFSVFGEYFRNSSERDLFLLSAPGAEKGLLSSWVRENMGTPERSAFLRAAAPQVCGSTSTSRTRPAAPAQLGAHSRQPPPGGLMPQ